MFHRTPFILPLLYPGLTWRLPSAINALYLTFDDGPVYGPTEFVLKTLEEKNARATFFCIGDNVAKHPAIFKEIIAQGHTVGNHTFNHLNGWRVAPSQYHDNVRRSDNVMVSIAPHVMSKQPRLFRPPYGRITKKQIGMLPDYRIIMWDVLTIDYNKRLSPEKCLRHSIAATRNGSIIVFHDSLKAEGNLRYVLPRYIDHFHGLGFQFNTIPA